MESVQITWLINGALSIVECPDNKFHYMSTTNPSDGVLSWHEARTWKRAIVPQFEVRYDTFITLLESNFSPWGEPPEDQTLYVALQSSYILDEVRYLLLSVAAFPTTLEGSVPMPWKSQDTLELIKRFCLIHEEKERPAHPGLLGIWNDIAEARENSRLSKEAYDQANARAKKLLETNLNESQLEELNTKKRFTVQGQDGKSYMVLHESHANVFLVEGTVPIINYCIVPSTSTPVPVYDQMLAQKLLLEFNIEDFMRIANATNIPAKLIEGAEDGVDALRTLVSRIGFEARIADTLRD